MMHDARLPDCSLNALRVGVFPDRLRGVFIREAAYACARYVLAGGELGDIREELCRIREGRLILFPSPKPRQAVPGRRSTEHALRALAASWDFVLRGPMGQLRFLLAFARQIGARSWARVFVDRLHREKAFHHARAYQNWLRAEARIEDDGVKAQWVGEGTVSELVEWLERCPGQYLRRGMRSDVFRGVFQGRDVVVKQFHPSPQAWRAGFCYSRARRAWAGAQVLTLAGLGCPEPLGWVERIRENGAVESWFLSAPLLQARTVRDVLREGRHTLSPAERTQFRHRLRHEIRRLHVAGIYHRDCKLGNLLLDDAGRFWWIDLEDIRCGGVPFWTLVRTFYQLNGSIPRQISRHEREAFANGFRRHFLFASHPLVLRYVEHQTRVRLGRELRGICRA